VFAQQATISGTGSDDMFQLNLDGQQITQKTAGSASASGA